MTKQNEYVPSIVFHPGETLEEKLQEMGMGPKEFALRTNKPEKTITAILKGDSSITSDMAVQFENVTKIPAHFWLKQQVQYDEFVARQKQETVFMAAESWARQFPLSDMIKKGWLQIPSNSTLRDKTSAILAFFGFANHTVWEEYYFNQNLKLAFRISLVHTKEPYAISAWLRKGELQAGELQATPYSEKAFKAALHRIKNLMSAHPDDFFVQLQGICLEAGVKVVYTPCLPKAPINGATRWLNDTPLIQLSGRHNRNDIFWFTFFHEAGHILLHGKKDIFLEDVEYTNNEADNYKEKEREADDFAVAWTFTEEQEREFIATYDLTDENIIVFADKINTHPGMIVGRLRRKKMITYSGGSLFFKSLTENLK